MRTNNQNSLKHVSRFKLPGFVGPLGWTDLKGGENKKDCMLVLYLIFESGMDLGTT